MTASAGSVAAQSWTGATSNDWTVGTNWVGGTVPTAGTNVTIDLSSPNPTVLGVTGAAIGVTNNLILGNTGTPSLTIQNGSTLTTNGAAARVGQGVSSNATVTVTGTGSQWIITTAPLFISNSGRGILNIESNGLVVTQNGIRVGGNAGSMGTLNISSGGTLETSVLFRSVGDSQANFDNGILRARASNASFINSFTAGQLNLAAGGLTVDTAGFTIGTDATSGFNGVGGLTVTGGGIFNLAANNTYTGATMINPGSTLALLGIGSVSSSSRVVANGTFNASGISGTGTSIQSLAGSGLVTLGTKNLTITNAANDVFSGTLSGTGALTIAGGMQTLSGNNAGYTSLTTVQGGTLAVNGVLGGPVNVLSAGRLQGIGTVGDTTNAGVIAPGNSIGTLTIAGNYTGNGGTLQIESTLGGDSSPTDKLVVTGNTAGSTFVRVTNVGGTGAQTVEGVKIVDVGGASNGTFTLQGDYVIQGQQAVVGGAYAYTLQKNGVSTPADGDWYLRSSLINPPPAAPAGPLYQPGVPLYESYGQILLRMNGLSTFRQRVGGRYSEAGDVAAPGASPNAPSPIWARVEGQHTKMTPSTTTGSTYTADQMKLQSGFDGLAYANSFGQLIFGISAHYTTLSSDITSFYGNGKVKVEGAGVGGSLTWFGENGFYVDGQSQVTWYKSDLSSDLVGTLKNDNSGFGYAFGAESGRRIPLGGALSLTPQAQLVYSSVNFGTFNDRFGAAVSNDRADSLQGRAGLSLDHQRAWLGSDGRTARSDIYAITNLYYEFLDGTAVDVAGTRFTSSTDRLWGGIGAGGAYHWASDKYSLYGEVSFNTSLAHTSDNYAYRGTLGFRAKW